MGRYAHLIDGNGDLRGIAVHPGCTLEEYIGNFQLDMEQFSDRCQMPHSMIWRICRGTQDITSRTATCLSRGTNIDVSFWLKLQNHYDQQIADGIQVGYTPTYIYISDLGENGGDE